MQPQAYNRATDFTDRTGDDTDNSAINLELDAAAISINEIRDNLELIQRDDGQLVNGIVTADALDDSAFDAVQASVNAATVEAQNSANAATIAATTANLAKDAAIIAKTSAETARDASILNANASANSAAASATSEAAALASKNAAQTSQSSAAASSTTATTKAAEAASSATNSANSAASALAIYGNTATMNNAVNTATTSATTATTKASEAGTSAASALTSANNAATSATSATGSASTATTKASEASTSVTFAATSASTATTKASEASTSANSALSSKNAAATSETNAASSASSASTSATTATTKASEAATSETNAATSASNAASSASTALTAQSATEAARDTTLAALDNFDDRYLGQKASDPTVDNDGNALLTGALYFNTATGTMKVYEGSAWVSAYASLSGALLVTNNLSDLSSASAARTNLGLGSFATKSSALSTDITDFGTAASAAAPVQSVAGKTGAVSLSVADISGAQASIGYTPYNATNPNGYITSSGSITGNAATATLATNTSSISGAVGVGYTWTAAQYFQSNAETGSGSNPPLQAYSSSGGAIMAFHRAGAFGLNFGLDSDNVIRIGGWSASPNRLQMDMSGNLTMSGNVTAYSDEKLKKNWRPVQDNFVSKLANVKSGIYDRVDQEVTQAGISAQSLQKVLPETVIEDSSGTLSVNYGAAAMVACVELAKVVEELRAEMAALKRSK